MKKHATRKVTREQLDTARRKSDFVCPDYSLVDIEAWPKVYATPRLRKTP